MFVVSGPVALGWAKSGEPRMPSQFGKYEIIETLGQGGMGTVYKARDVASGQILALKLLRAGSLRSAKARERLVREGRAMAKLRHRNIVPVHDAGEIDGVPYVAMEYIEGVPLSGILKGGALKEERAARWMVSIAYAVGHAHAHGVIHRDLKPGNIIIDHADEPMVTDFGLAEDVSAEGNSTRTGDVIGTPSYMSPEQARGKPVDARSDVFGLGGLLHTMLTGRPPFSGPVASTVYRVLHSDPEPIGAVNPSVSEKMQAICLKAMQKRPEARYQQAGDLAADLCAVLAQRGLLRTQLEVGRHRLLRRLREPRTVRIGLVSASLLAVAVAALLVWRPFSKARGATLAEIDSLIAKRDYQAALVQAMNALHSTVDAELTHELVPRIQLIQVAVNPCPEGDRLLAQGRFSEAENIYRRAGADPIRCDLPGQLSRLRSDVAQYVERNAPVQVTLADGSAIAVRAVRGSAFETDQGVRDWASLSRQNIYLLHRACQSEMAGPAFTQSHVNLGMLCVVLGLKEEAKAEFDRAVGRGHLSPSRAAAYVELPLLTADTRPAGATTQPDTKGP